MRTVIAKCTNSACNQGDASCLKRYSKHTGPVHFYEEGENLGEIFELKTHGISEKVKHLIWVLELILATNGYKYHQHTGEWFFVNTARENSK